jgi:hypothetical protein
MTAISLHDISSKNANVISGIFSMQATVRWTVGRKQIEKIVQETTRSVSSMSDLKNWSFHSPVLSLYRPFPSILQIKCTLDVVTVDRFSLNIDDDSQGSRVTSLSSCILFLFFSDRDKVLVIQTRQNSMNVGLL